MTTNRMAGLFEAADLPYTDHREYLWSTELSKDKPKAEWNFKEEDEDRDFLSHILYLKSAVLGTSAETGEDNVIEVETTDYSGSLLKVPIAFLNKGQKNMCQIDHSFDQSTPATFRLISGKGPVFLTAQHQVEFPQEEEEDSDEYGEHGTQSEEEVSREEEEEENGDAGGKASKARKRKATTPASGKEKRGKLDSKSIENQDESMEASTNGTESDEDDEDFEEEEEEEDESEEEDEESPEKSKKSKKKKGATNGKAASKKVAPAKSKPAPAKKAKGKKAK